MNQCDDSALAQLCSTYWYSLYAYARQRGHSPHDAQDIIPKFIARLLEKETQAASPPEGVRFRPFLQEALDTFVADEWPRAKAEKRNGSSVAFFDAGEAEARFGQERANGQPAQKLFERTWALALLDSVYLRLQTEFENAGHLELFLLLKPCLAGDSKQAPYAQWAAELGRPEDAVKEMVRGLRERYRDVLREEVAMTVSSPAEIEAELRYLFRALSGA